MASEVDVGILGAGLAGLSCARRLRELGIACTLFDAADRIGGRVATDTVDGFLLDHGFQVLLDSYPEVDRSLDLKALGARPFLPGALVRKDGRFWRVVDPWRSLLGGLGTLSAPFVTLSDGMHMALLRSRALEGASSITEGTTADFLASSELSGGLRQSFFEPFFRGVTLDPALEVPAWYFLDLFGWFATGSAVLPADGMRAIPAQLASALPEGSLRLGRRATGVERDSIQFEGGERVTCEQVVLATDGSACSQLLGNDDTTEWLGTTTLHYAADSSPVGEPILVLNGEGPAAGPVNHLCVLSDAQPSYAPPGQALVSVSLLGVSAASDEELDAAARAQLAGWYGDALASWKLLRTERVPRALPRFSTRPASTTERDGVLVCGDHVATPSIQGSMESGRLVAEAIHARRTR